MKFFTGFRVRAALIKQQKGDIEGARRSYAELYDNKVLLASYLLPYSLLLIRAGEYEKAKQVLLDVQKAPDLNLERKQQLYVNYGVALWKLGDEEGAIRNLEAAHHKYPSGIVYQTLGYLYIEQGNKEKALSYNEEALEYDHEDPIVLDNMGQTFYRLLNDKESALEYFKKAHKINSTKIDTLYFLAKYDIENGNDKAALEKIEIALAGNFSPLNYATEEKLNHLKAQIKE